MWSDWRRALFGKVCIGFLLTGSPCLAEPAPVGGTRLSFVRATSASDCVSSMALEREITRRMGRDPFSGTPRQWIEGFITKQGTVFEVQLFERNADGKTLGTRQLRESSSDCHKLDDAIVLAIALIIDPSAQLAPPSTSALESGPRMAPLAPGASTAAASEAPLYAARLTPLPDPTVLRDASAHRVVDHDASAHRVVDHDASAHRVVDHDAPTKTGSTIVTTDAVIVFGVMPGTALGAELTTKVTVDDRSRYALRVSALYVPERRPESALGDLGYGLSAMEAGVCASTAPRRVVGSFCTGFGIGAIHTVVHDPNPLDPGDRLWLALRLEGMLAVSIVGPLQLQARIFGLVLPQRWEFRVRNSAGQLQRAYLQSQFAPGGGLGLGLAF